jgi:hypothetical protein
MLKKTSWLIPALWFAYSCRAENDLPKYLDTTIQAGNKRSYGQISGFFPTYYDNQTLIFIDARLMHNMQGWKKKPLKVTKLGRET